MLQIKYRQACNSEDKEVTQRCYYCFVSSTSLNQINLEQSPARGTPACGPISKQYHAVPQMQFAGGGEI